jgi:hypothetical protein
LNERRVTVQYNPSPLKPAKRIFGLLDCLSGAQLFVLNHNNRVFIVSQRSASLGPVADNDCPFGFKVGSRPRVDQ